MEMDDLEEEVDILEDWEDWEEGWEDPYEDEEEDNCWWDPEEGIVCINEGVEG
jgi:hypothetical protein